MYAIYYSFGIVRSLFRRSGPTDPAVLVPVVNLAFFAAVYFVYEGQGRYNFPLLFLFVVALFQGAAGVKRSIDTLRSA